MATKATRRKSGDVHIALLRGINVGGKNVLPMKALAAMFADIGCTDVRTYIQSGNVVYRAGTSLAGRVPDLVSRAIQKTAGLTVPVVTRTSDDLHDVARRNPFLHPGADPSRLHVMFLADAPTKARIASLDPDRSPPDEFAVRGREIYLHCPDGMGKSKLTNAWFDSKLATTGTARNWRTVLALIAMADALVY
jgi:uncharacterized protein (DUF1697 family)